jgi:predicted metal-dependent phosphoesterase TrpH
VIGDFHVHSDCSDGRLAPAALIDVLADAGVQIAALTDHDTTAGAAEAATRARERGLTLLPGIEMTTFGFERVIHVLGLGVDPEHAELAEANRIAMAVWDANQCRWVHELAGEGLDINVDRDFADHPVRLPVLIERLCTRGFAGGDPVQAHAAFREFFHALPTLAYRPLLAPADAGGVIRAAGGVAIVAHPYHLNEALVLERLLIELDGIEALYLPYTDAQREQLRDVAERNGKLISSGSDYHGYFSAGYRRPPWAAPDALVRRLLDTADSREGKRGLGSV